MQVKTLAVEQTSFLHLRDANDELLHDNGEPVGITLYGPGTKAYAKAQAARSNRAIDRLKKKGKSDASPEENAEENATFLASITKEFHHLESDGLAGEALFKAVYKDSEVGFIAEQAMKHAGEWGNFSKGSAKN
jgi:hypothetical protein